MQGKIYVKSAENYKKEKKKYKSATRDFCIVTFKKRREIYIDAVNTKKKFPVFSGKIWLIHIPCILSHGAE